MKFLHLGDLHIGKSLGDFDLGEDQEYILNQIINIIKEKSVDAILIAGDVYDKSVPSENAVRIFDDFICELAKIGVYTFIISGNHDSDERLNFGSALFTSNRIYISSKYNKTLFKQTVEDDFGPLNIYLMPFVKASRVKHFYPDSEINGYDDAVRVVIENTDIDFTQRNVIVAHQFVVGGTQDPVLGGSEGSSVKNVGTVEKINSAAFDGFDYVALGHIHSGQSVGRDEIRYSGSPLKYSLSEVNSHKSVPLITFNEKGNMDIELLELMPMRDMRHIKGKLNQLLDASNITSENDFIYATLTDEDFVNDAMSIFQQYYPNTIKVDYDNSHTRELDIHDIEEITEGKSFEEIISDFYRQMYGCDISQEELSIMLEVAGEAGVSVETD